MNIIKKINIYLYISILVIIDQISKIYIIKNCFNTSKDIIKNILRFTYCENKGGAFSLASGKIYLFIIMNLIIISGLIIYYEKNRKKIKTFEKISITLIISGGLSNLLDRIFRGFVVDFIDINQLFNYAIFNVADMFIVVGIFSWIIYLICNINKNS